MADDEVERIAILIDGIADDEGEPKEISIDGTAFREALDMVCGSMIDAGGARRTAVLCLLNAEEKWLHDVVAFFAVVELSAFFLDRLKKLPEPDQTFARAVITTLIQNQGNSILKEAWNRTVHKGKGQEDAVRRSNGEAKSQTEEG